MKSTDTMNKQMQAVSNDLSSFADDARALLAATADIAGEKVSDARQRLTATVNRAREVASNVRDQGVNKAKAVDLKVRENPYQAIGIAVGVGALLGFLLARR